MMTTTLLSLIGAVGIGTAIVASVTQHRLHAMLGFGIALVLPSLVRVPDNQVIGVFWTGVGVVAISALVYRAATTPAAGPVVGVVTGSLLGVMV